jgi:hypothetical protein
MNDSHKHSKNGDHANGESSFLLIGDFSVAEDLTTSRIKILLKYTCSPCEHDRIDREGNMLFIKYSLDTRVRHSTNIINSDSGRSTCVHKSSHNLAMELAMNMKHKPRVS